MRNRHGEPLPARGFVGLSPLAEAVRDIARNSAQKAENET